MRTQNRPQGESEGRPDRGNGTANGSSSPPPSSSRQRPNKNLSATTVKKRVAIVDDHTMLRDGMRMLVNVEPDLTCCWTAANAGEALALVESDKPDLLTVDISLPGRNGLELIKDVLSIAPDLSILVISMHDEVFYTQRVLKAGAKGYVTKGADRQVLLQAIRQVADGGIFVSPEMSTLILEAFSGRPSNQPVDGVHLLSDREFEVFQLVSDGQSTNQIGAMLNISVKTVHQHLSRIKEKLKLPDGITVLRYAVRWAERLKFGTAAANR